MRRVELYYCFFGLEIMSKWLSISVYLIVKRFHPYIKQEGGIL
ncbi:hypothetical protein [Gracilibacillus xinjiangensis]|uniref:Uncharacterized protein n=1 Tax=Gracilibacillus xinjiangensis TaxID=1193282 RepID=A0ABV8WZ24_9BACI